MLKIIGGIVVAILLFLLVVGGIGRCSGASWAGADDDTSQRDKAQDVLDNVDESTTVDDLASDIQDNFDNVRPTTARSIATAILTACKPDKCESLSIKLDSLNDKNADNQEKVLALLRSAPTTASSPPLKLGGDPPLAGQPPMGQPPVSGGACKPGDKVATFSEGNNPHRIEVGGHGVQHVDFDPEKGVKAVSYIVGGIANPSGIPNIWWGYGSIWEWNPPGCDYNYVQDGLDYAKARLDSGHSGLVIDLRGSTPQIVGNIANLGPEQIASILGQDAKAMRFANGSTVNLDYFMKGQIPQNQPGQQNNPPTQVPQPRNQVPAPPQQAPQQPAQPVAPAPPVVTQPQAPVCTGVRQADATRPNGADSTWTITGPAVANVWNPANNGDTEHKLFVAEGAPKTLTGYGGSSWQYPSGCNAKAQADYDANQLSAFTG